MEFASRTFGPDTFLTRLRPKPYKTIPEDTLNATLKDMHDFTQFSVREAQKIVFAQELDKTLIVRQPWSTLSTSLSLTVPATPGFRRPRHRLLPQPSPIPICLFRPRSDHAIHWVPRRVLRPKRHQPRPERRPSRHKLSDLETRIPWSRIPHHAQGGASYPRGTRAVLGSRASCYGQGRSTHAAQRVWSAALSV